MNRLSTSIRSQVIVVTVFSLLILAMVLVAIDFTQRRDLLIKSEHRIGITLIRSVNNTINSVRSFITTLYDIAELNTRLGELVELNDNIDFIAVTDDAGFVIFHSDEAFSRITIPELTELSTEETVARNIAGFGEVYLTALLFDSDELIEAAQYQVVVASASEPINNQLVNQVLSSVLITALFTLVTASAIIILMQYYFVRPVEQLTHVAEAIEAGDLSQQVHIRQNNEIGQLGHSFNRMVHQLSSLIDDLENRVRERTHDLEIARDQAEQASRAKSDFLSNMSHELRTPLNMVIGYTSSMLTMPEMYNHVELPPVYHKDIGLIRNSGKHLLTLINDILDLSKVEAGKLELNFTTVNLNNIFDDAVAISIGLIEDKPIQIRQTYPPDLPLIWADNTRIRQIILNLMSNAIKYTPTGTVTLFAEVCGAQVYISVTDTGPGIPENALSTIFDRFEQIQTNTQIQGTGLGLDISQRLAKLHGSEITIDSKVGSGSTFALSLDVATESQIAESVTVDSLLQGNSELFTDSASLQMLVMIIIPYAETRTRIRRILESLNLVVIEASDAKHAYEMASGLLPEMILLDEDMPDDDIDNLLNMLQADPELQDIPLVLLGAEDNPNGRPSERFIGKLDKSADQAHMAPIIRTFIHLQTEDKQNAI